MHRNLKLIAACVFLLMLGCGGPPEPKYDNVYRGLSENLPRLDTAILDGRRILIDPGHGGHFRGTLGQDGLEESRVNLGVSLYLWGLLREAGAEVFLTRSAEKDFLNEADSTLAGELGVRVAMVDSLEPDILVSIHHNAQNDRDPDKNATETYYRFGDPASRDLAFAVHRHLMRNLGIDEGEVRPGNYFILRNIDIPAILGEGSYLTNPGVEGKLRLSEKQRLEAEAYFLGILEYFSRGTPHIEIVSPIDTTLVDVPLLSFAVGDIGGIGIDPASVDLRINEQSADAHINIDGSAIAYPMPWDSPNGSYSVAIGLRNLLGNSSEVRRLRFDLDLPPQSATVETDPTSLPVTGGAIRVRARILDRRGLSIADGAVVTIETSNGRAPSNAVVHNGFIEFPVTVTAGQTALRLTLSARDTTFELTMGQGNDPVRVFRDVVVADVGSRDPIRNATVFLNDSLVANGSASGVYFLPGDVPQAAPSTDRLTASGYQPIDRAHADVLPDTLFMTPWFEGALIGRRFMLDPEGGFGAEPGMGQLGLSGPFVNLQVARYLAEYLKAAGAQVRLTRHNEQTLSPRDVVSLTNHFGADRYIEIRHRVAPEDSGLTIDTYFFPGSRNGLAMARSIQTYASQMLELDEQAPTDLVTYPLQQTACPAIVVEYPSLGSIEEETRLAEPWYQRKQAYAVFAGILTHFGVIDTVQLTVQIETDDSPGNWLITIDGTWNLLSDPGGFATFIGLPSDRSAIVDARRQRKRLRTPTAVPPSPHTSSRDTLRVKASP